MSEGGEPPVERGGPSPTSRSRPSRRPVRPGRNGGTGRRQAASTLSLSAADRDRFREALRALLSPLDHPAVDEWRSAVNRAVAELLGADKATFLLPAEGVEPLYSEQVDLELLRAYSEYDRTLLRDRDLWRTQVEMGVWTRDTLTRPAIPDLEETEYWNDLIVPMRAFDSLGASVAMEGTERPATLFYHHDRPSGPKFGPRGEALLHLLYPAFAAGVESWRRLASWRNELTSLLDALPAPTQLRDGAGRELHRNRALRSLLASDPERGRIEDALAGTSESLLAAVRSEEEAAEAALRHPPSRRVETARGPYRISGAYVRPELIDGKGAAPGVLLTVRGPGRRLPTLEELKERTRLTEREAEVALLLAARRTNREIAEALVISPHTARHHTEQVLRKLGLRSRRRVRRALLRATRPPGKGGAA